MRSFRSVSALCRIRPFPASHHCRTFTTSLEDDSSSVSLTQIRIDRAKQIRDAISRSEEAVRTNRLGDAAALVDDTAFSFPLLELNGDDIEIDMPYVHLVSRLLSLRQHYWALDWRTVDEVAMPHCDAIDRLAEVLVKHSENLESIQAAVDLLERSAASRLSHYRRHSDSLLLRFGAIDSKSAATTTTTKTRIQEKVLETLERQLGRTTGLLEAVREGEGTEEEESDAKWRFQVIRRVVSCHNLRGCVKYAQEDYAAAIECHSAAMEVLESVAASKKMRGWKKSYGSTLNYIVHARLKMKMDKQAGESGGADDTKALLHDLRECVGIKEEIFQGKSMSDRPAAAKTKARVKKSRVYRRSEHGKYRALARIYHDMATYFLLFGRLGDATRWQQRCHTVLMEIAIAHTGDDSLMFAADQIDAPVSLRSEYSGFPALCPHYSMHPSLEAVLSHRTLALLPEDFATYNQKTKRE